MEFKDNTHYQSLVTISEQIRMCLRMLASNKGYTIVIERMLVEHDRVIFTFSINQTTRYLIAGYYAEAHSLDWYMNCPMKWPTGYEVVNPDIIIAGSFIKEGDLL